MWASQWCICIYDLLQARAALMLALWTLWPQAGEIAADASQHQTRLVEIQIQIQIEIQMRLKYWILRETPWAKCQNLMTKNPGSGIFIAKVSTFSLKGDDISISEGVKNSIFVFFFTNFLKFQLKKDEYPRIFILKG